VKAGTSDKATVRLGPFDAHGITRARHQGRWIEVEHGIPGELVRVEIHGGQRQFGRITKIIEPAADRITAPCPYFREWSCGGCQWQQISYEGQLARKRSQVDAAMTQAHLDISVEAVHALDDPWRYRSTAGIALGKRAGFRRRASLAIVPIQDCPISHLLIGELMARLNRALDAGSLPDFHGRLRLEVRVTTEPEDTLQVLIQPDHDRAPSAVELATLIETLAAMPIVSSILRSEPDDSVQTLKGDPFGRVSLQGRPVVLSAAAFFQTNLALLPTLITRLQVGAEQFAGKRVADVYGGIGIFGLFLADRVAEVVVVESNPIAVEACERTAHAWGLTNVRAVIGTAEQTLTSAEQFDAVIVDPPRAGLSDAVIDELIRRPPAALFYISCLAKSLARDLTRLTAAGYTVESLELFDFYPQTYHVELLAVLRR
jgi:23S rRNA (uracil1939-C5)-methyltransferase